ncbi:alpha/beta fold hydrolase [Sandaracinus amylolyticus]|uniref:alpha/beta fold hydrolase n=1 Tax=Sandaracinus amylolyticus TaxID=927083 RepID=UPI001F3F8FFF|nr:alpha/beta hydrolase [Sandaracinus amylolyticus]UJR80200.1 Pimeloyl-ACP methyl ester carboxylesterase [Sandaracinus amylolyticus]
MSELHVSTVGDGDPVVLLHSGGMSSRQWRKVSERLAPSYRVIAPDFLGSGESPPHHEPFDHVQDVEAVERVIDRAGAPVHLVGHSYGGLVALTIARRRPGTILSLAVYDPVAFELVREANDAEALADLDRAARDPIFTDDARGGSAEWYRAFVEFWNGKGAWDALPEERRASFLRVGAKVYLEVRSLMRDATRADAYRAISAPTLLMHGQRSPIVAHRIVAILGRTIARASVRAIEGAGHMGPITHGDVVERAIAEHLSGAT